MGKRLSQFHLYNNFEFRGIVEIAAIFRAEAILDSEPNGSGARQAMADDLINGTYGRKGEAVSRMARMFITNGDVLKQSITGDTLHPHGLGDDLIDWLTDTNWDAVAAAVYGDLVPDAPEPEETERTEGEG